MSKKQPEIKVIYPDASPAAMLLTDAMIRRSTGKRVVETNSEEKEYTGEMLFGGVLTTKTDTSVELTLRLNPDAMDYALTTLIAKNLTEEEKRVIRMETDSMEIVDLLSPAQAAEAPGQALDGDSSADVPSAEREAATQSDLQKIIYEAMHDHFPHERFPDLVEELPAGTPGFAEDLARRIRLHEKVKAQGSKQEKQIEIGKISDKDLRNILTDMIVSMDEGTETADAIDTAITEVKERAGEQEEKIEIGKISPGKLSGIIGKVVADAWMDSGDKDSPTINEYIDRAMNAIREAANMHAESEEIREARNAVERYLAVLLYIAPDEDWDRADLVQCACDTNDLLHPHINQEYPEDIRIQDLRNMIYQCGMIATRFGKKLTSDILEEELEKIQKGIEPEKPKKSKKGRKKKADPSRDDVEAEARQMQAPALKQSAAPLADTASGDEEAATLREAADGEIDAGLLNDVEDEDHAE